MEERRSEEEKEMRVWPVLRDPKEDIERTARTLPGVQFWCHLRASGISLHVEIFLAGVI